MQRDQTETFLIGLSCDVSELYIWYQCKKEDLSVGWGGWSRWSRLRRVTAEGCEGSGAGYARGSRASPPVGFDPELFQELSYLPDAELRECLGEYPDFLYHVARDKFGRLYFRVIRNLLLDRGTRSIGTNAVQRLSLHCSLHFEPSFVTSHSFLYISVMLCPSTRSYML